MIELEFKAAEAWNLMYDHAMPANIALDFVQDATGDREKALEAIVWQASMALGRLRLEIIDHVPGDFQHESACVGGLVFAGLTEAAARLKALTDGLYATEIAGRHVPQLWLDWCRAAGRTIGLCQELFREARPAPGPTPARS